MEVTTEMLVHFLSKTEVFADFDPDEIETFVPHLEFVGVEAEHTIFQEGSTGDGWWLILSGEVSVTKEMPSGPPHVLSGSKAAVGHLCCSVSAAAAAHYAALRSGRGSR